MNERHIDEQMKRYVEHGELSGAALIVRQAGSVVFQGKWGCADVERGVPIEYDSIYRMMSMTKCIIAAAVMKLAEDGKLSIDDPLANYVPEFSDIRVSCDPRYRYREGMSLVSLLPRIPFFRMDRVKTVDAVRGITLRDLLSHSSGLEQGVVGMIAMMKDHSERKDLDSLAKKYARYALDFQPGTGTGYSPLAGFDMLALVIERVARTDLETYLKAALFDPLGMKDTTFFPSDEQKRRIVSVYRRKKDVLVNVTGTKADIAGVLRRGEHYTSGSGGLYSTVTDYERFAQMLCADGRYADRSILKPETVAMMRTEAPALHLEPNPGTVWGLGVMIRQDRDRGKFAPSPGTYGWSGAFGTHFFVSPADGIDCVFATNRTDLGGAGSYVSRRIEELVFCE